MATNVKLRQASPSLSHHCLGQLKPCQEDACLNWFPRQKRHRLVKGQLEKNWLLHQDSGGTKAWSGLGQECPTPNLGTSICHGCNPKKTKKKKRPNKPHDDHPEEGGLKEGG